MNNPWVALLLLALVLPGTASARAAERIEGVALRLPQLTEVYRELHQRDPLDHRIEYRTPAGEVFAELVLDYRCSATAPAFRQLDHRDGHQIGAVWKDGRLLLLNGNATRPIDSRERLVTSSGFDRFIGRHWDALQAGDVVEFEFALPSQQRTLRMRVRPAPGAAADSLPDIPHWFVVEPANGLLRRIVDPVALGYDDRARLLVYRGRSNLPADDGAPLDVEIRYRYFTTFSPPATEPGDLAARNPVDHHCRYERS